MSGQYAGSFSCLALSRRTISDNTNEMESMFMAKDNREGIDVTKRIIGGGRTVDGIDYIEYVDGTRATALSGIDDGNTVGALSITVESDVSDAIKGFKALQREIRETTKALREYEAVSKRVNGDE